MLVNQLNFRSDIGHLVLKEVGGIGSRQNAVPTDIATAVKGKPDSPSGAISTNNSDKAISEDKNKSLRAISGEHVARYREREKLEWLHSALRGIVEHSKLRKGDILKMRQVVEKANFVSSLATKLRSQSTASS